METTIKKFQLQPMTYTKPTDLVIDSSSRDLLKKTYPKTGKLIKTLVIDSSSSDVKCTSQVFDSLVS